VRVPVCVCAMRDAIAPVATTALLWFATRDGGCAFLHFGSRLSRRIIGFPPALSSHHQPVHRSASRSSLHPPHHAVASLPGGLPTTTATTPGLLPLPALRPRLILTPRKTC